MGWRKIWRKAKRVSLQLSTLENVYIEDGWYSEMKVNDWMQYTDGRGGNQHLISPNKFDPACNINELKYDSPEWK